MRILTTRGIIWRNHQLFCVLHKKGDGINDFWCTPGGKLDPGESLLDGLKREMIEETGVEPEIGPLLYVQQYNDEANEYLEFFFRIDNVADYEKIELEKTSHGTIEIAEYGFIDTKTTRVLPEFLHNVDMERDVRGHAPTQYFKEFKG